MQSIALIFCYPRYSILLPVLMDIRFLCSISFVSSFLIRLFLRRSLLTSCTTKKRCTKNEKRCLLLPCTSALLLTSMLAAFLIPLLLSRATYYIVIIYCYYTVLRDWKTYTVHLLRILNIAVDAIRKTFVKLNAFKKRTITWITFHKIIQRLKHIIHVAEY